MKIISLSAIFLMVLALLDLHYGGVYIAIYQSVAGPIMHWALHANILHLLGNLFVILPIGFACKFMCRFKVTTVTVVVIASILIPTFLMMGGIIGKGIGASIIASALCGLFASKVKPPIAGVLLFTYFLLPDLHGAIFLAKISNTGYLQHILGTVLGYTIGYLETLYNPKTK